MRVRQLKMLDRNMLGFYSRAEMSLVLALLVLEAKGFKWCSVRALGAFFGHSSHAIYTVTNKAHENGLIQMNALPRNKLVALTEKGKQIVYGAITRVARIRAVNGVSRVEQVVGKVS